MEDRKLVDFAHWLNDHPGEWNLWPYLIPIQADRRDTAASMRLVMDRIKNHRYDEFRVDTALLEYELFNGFMGFDNGGVHENGLACFASMFVRQVRQCFSAVWADGFPRCRHRFPVM